jgi:Holliday junction resolvase RusA-like endonuclease
MIYKAEIQLCPVSKSNSYKVTKSGRLRVSKEVEVFESFFIKLLPEEVANANIENPFCLELDLWVQNKAQDLDNLAKSILDCLETAGAFENDNLCYRLIMNKFIDKNDPRIKLKLYEL